MKDFIREFSPDLAVIAAILFIYAASSRLVIALYSI